MIKYELKKLFTNKFVIAMFAVIFTVILAIAIYTYSEYKKGMRVEPILMKKWTVTETAVTKDNIFDFIARYDQIKNDDDNYDYVDTSKRGNSRYLQGSKTTEIEAKINELIKGLNGHMNKVAMVVEMEVMLGLSNMGFHSPKLTWLQLLLIARSANSSQQE